MPTPHGSHIFMHTILPGDISTLFAEALEKFEPISGQPTDSYLAEIREVISQILLVILYDKENRIHNLVSLIQYTMTYTTDYTATLTCPRNPSIYDEPIRDDEKAPVRAKKEEIHKERLQYFTMYKAAEHETGKLILSIVEEAWVRELKKFKTYYTLVTLVALVLDMSRTRPGLVPTVPFLANVLFS